MNRPVMKDNYINLDEESRQVGELTNDQALSDREQVRQLELQEGYKNLLDKHHRGEIVTDELLAFRLHAGTLGDSIEKRSKQARKEFEVEKLMGEMLREGSRGESPEQFYKEVRRKARDIETAKIQAHQQVGLPIKPAPKVKSAEDKILEMQNRMTSRFNNQKFDTPYMKGSQFN